jgi:spermidine/putrescine transport system permease protein
MDKAFKFATIGIICFWLICFVFLPNIMAIVVSFMSKTTSDLYVLDFTLENYKRLLAPNNRDIFFSSLFYAGITTLSCLIFAFPFAYIISRMKSAYKSIYLLLIIVPFWTSALVRVYALSVIIGNNGIINRILLGIGAIDEPLKILYTETAVVIGLVYTLIPYMILPLYASFEKLDKRYIEAASDLGAGWFSTLSRIIVPLTTPGIVAGSLLVFLPALGLYYVPNILWQKPEVLLIGNLIENQFVKSPLNFPYGTAISTALTLLMAILLFVNYKSVRTAAKRGIM